MTLAVTSRAAGNSGSDLMVQAVTPPTGPTVVVIDMELQKEEAREFEIPKFRPAVIAGVDNVTAREIAQSLLAARNPRLNSGLFRTPEGSQAAVALAEMIGACVPAVASESFLVVSHKTRVQY